jgi:hypothetical protein
VNPHARILFVVTAVFEMSTGISLVAAPSMAAGLLMGSSLDTGAGTTVGRIAGAALCSLGILCWLARNDEKSPAALGIVTGLLIYNVAAVAVLVSAGVAIGPTGSALWPAVVLHTGLAGWCVLCLRTTH